MVLKEGAKFLTLLIKPSMQEKIKIYQLKLNSKNWMIMIVQSLSGLNT
jgi:hypothetical protein